MNQTTEKSCWSVTAWALAVALGVGVVGSIIANSGGGQELAAVVQNAD